MLLWQQQQQQQIPDEWRNQQPHSIYLLPQNVVATCSLRVSLLLGHRRRLIPHSITITTTNQYTCCCCLSVKCLVILRTFVCSFTGFVSVFLPDSWMSCNNPGWLLKQKQKKTFKIESFFWWLWVKKVQKIGFCVAGPFYRSKYILKSDWIVVEKFRCVLIAKVSNTCLLLVNLLLCF